MIVKAGRVVRHPELHQEPCSLLARVDGGRLRETICIVTADRALRSDRKLGDGLHERRHDEVLLRFLKRLAPFPWAEDVSALETCDLHFATAEETAQQSNRAKQQPSSSGLTQPKPLLIGS